MSPRQVALLHPSITPASVLPAAEAARQTGGWLVAEESLGVTGAGDLAILTSAETYRFAAGTKDALAQKLASLAPCARVLLAPGIDSALPQAIQLEDVAEVTGTSCRIDAGGRTGSFTNDLLAEEAYRIPLMLAGSAACLLGIDPAGLSAFAGVEGRMNVRVEDGLVIVDNANSGTTQATTIAAAELARRRASSEGLTLVIGTEPGDGKVCEGFSEDEMISTVRAVHPDRLVVVGDSLRLQALPQEMLSGVFIHRAPTLAAGTEAAVNAAGHGAVVLAVKTWR